MNTAGSLKASLTASTELTSVLWYSARSSIGKEHKHR